MRARTGHVLLRKLARAGAHSRVHVSKPSRAYACAMHSRTPPGCRRPSRAGTRRARCVSVLARARTTRAMRERASERHEATEPRSASADTYRARAAIAPQTSAEGPWRGRPGQPSIKPHSLRIGPPCRPRRPDRPGRHRTAGRLASLSSLGVWGAHHHHAERRPGGGCCRSA